MTSLQKILCENVHVISLEACRMEEEKYIHVEDSTDLMAFVLAIAEEYTKEHADGDEEDYYGSIIPYAERKLFDKFGVEQGSTYHEIAGDALFGDPMHKKAAQYAMRHQVSTLDYDWWIHTMEIMQYEITYQEYGELSEAMDTDMMELDDSDAPELLRCLLNIRKKEHL